VVLTYVADDGYRNSALCLGEAVRIEFRTIEELHSFIRGSMLTQMYANVQSMRACGASEAAIQQMRDSTEQRIAEALDEVSEMFEATLEDFNKPITIN
jgi:hypothetical protein